MKVGDPVTHWRSRASGANAQAGAGRQGRIVKVYPELERRPRHRGRRGRRARGFFVGERVPVWITVAERQALLAPAAAVQTRSGVDYVRVAGAGGALDVPVVLGAGAGTARVEILSGLRAGDRVVTP